MLVLSTTFPAVMRMIFADVNCLSVIALLYCKNIFIYPYIKQSKYSINAIELLVPCAFFTVLSFRHITGFKHSKNGVKTTYIALNNYVVQSFMFIFSFKKGKQFHDILTNRNRPNIKRMT